MFDDIITNKYFVIALIVVIVVLLYLYCRKPKVSVEAMTSLAPIEAPWTEDIKEGIHKYVSTLESKLDNLIDNKPDNTKPKKQYSSVWEVQEGHPKPMDPNPEFGNCVPCVCPKAKKTVLDTDSE